MNEVHSTRSNSLPVMATAIALNVVLAVTVQTLKLPIYVDAVGTILATLLLGLTRGAIVGAVSFLIASVVISPVYIYFIGTQVVIAAYTWFVAKYLHGFRTIIRTLATGVGLGIVAGIVSAPIIVLVFGGATGSGRDILTALLVGSGEQIVKAVLLSGAASEPIDKTIQCFLALLILRRLPKFVSTRFSNKIFTSNFGGKR